MTKLQLRRRPRGRGYDYRDDPEYRDFVPECEACEHRARWMIGIFRDFDRFGIERWVAEHAFCGTHLSPGLSTINWDADEVKIWDLANYPELS